MSLRRALLIFFMMTLLPLTAVAEEGHEHALSADDIGLESVPPPLRNLEDAVPWETFFETTFKREETYVKDYDLFEYHEVPTYSDAVKKLEGKTIRVKGYILVDEEESVHHSFLISAFRPMGCGHYHGPGSLVVEVFPKQPLETAPKRPAIYEGTLEFPDDPKTSFGIFYRLKDAVPVE